MCNTHGTMWEIGVGDSVDWCHLKPLWMVGNDLSCSSVNVSASTSLAFLKVMQQASQVNGNTTVPSSSSGGRCAHLQFKLMVRGGNGTKLASSLRGT